MATIPTLKDNLVIENIRPQVEGGRFMIKREPGDTVTLQADIFRHSHEKYDAAIFYRHLPPVEPAKKATKASKASRPVPVKWEQASMHFVDNDLWEGSFTVNNIGYYEYRFAPGRRIRRMSRRKAL